MTSTPMLAAEKSDHKAIARWVEKSEGGSVISATKRVTVITVKAAGAKRQKRRVQNSLSVCAIETDVWANLFTLRVITNPEIAKKMSTPINPAGRMLLKCESITARTAKPRSA